MSVTNLATREDMINVDLDKQKLTRGNGIKLLGYHDMVGDVIGIRAFKDDQAFDLTGYNCVGYYILPTGETFTINGTIAGTPVSNEAKIWLPAECYDYEGPFTLAIKLVHATHGDTGTVRIVDGIVTRTETGTIVDPLQIIDLDVIIAKISQMETATTAANNAASAANTAAAAAEAAASTVASVTALTDGSYKLVLGPSSST